MGRTCTVCSHKDVDEINRLLLCSDSLRDIARQFGLSKDALARHKESHIAELLSKSIELKAEVESFQGNQTLAEVRELKVRALEILEQAQRAGDLRTAFLGIREARGCLELCLKAEDRIKLNQAQKHNGNREDLFDEIAKYEKQYKAEYIAEQMAALEGVYRGEVVESKMSEAVKKELAALGIDRGNYQD